MSQLTKPDTCKRKHKYWTDKSATRAKYRRNKASGYNYLRKYKCNLGDHWHLTTEDKADE